MLIGEQPAAQKLTKLDYVEERFTCSYTDLLFRVNTEGKLMITEVSTRDHQGRTKIYNVDPQIDAIQFDLTDLDRIPRMIGEQQYSREVIILREDASISVLIIVALDNQQGQERISKIAGNLESVLASDNYRYYLFTNLASNITDIAVDESILVRDHNKLVHELTYEIVDGVIIPRLTLISDPSDPIEQIIPGLLISDAYAYRRCDFSKKIALPDNCRILTDEVYILDDRLGANIHHIGERMFTLKTTEGCLNPSSIKKMLGWNECLVNDEDDGDDCAILDDQDNLWLLRYPSLQFELYAHNVIDVNYQGYNTCYIDADNNLHIIDGNSMVFSIPGALLLRGTHYRERANWMKKRVIA